MRHPAGAAAVTVTISLAASVSVAWAQTSAVQRNNVSVNREGSSVTVSGQTVTVETAANGGRVVGNGQPASQNRQIGPVSAIAVDGAFAVTVRTGPTPGVTVEADKNLLPIVRTEVSNRRLDIYTDRSYSSDGRIKVAVISPDLTEITASGSNEITCDGLNGGNLAISLNGSNHAVLRGKLAAMTAQLSGSNQLIAQELSTGSVVIRVSGSGSASVNARERIAAEISGAGNIAVYGNPKERNTRVMGAGKIRFVE